MVLVLTQSAASTAVPTTVAAHTQPAATSAVPTTIVVVHALPAVVPVHWKAPTQGRMM